MNVAVARRIGEPAQASGRCMAAMDAGARAWRSMGRRQWLAAAGLGLLYGVARTAIVVLGLWDDAKPRARFDVIAVVLTSATTLMTLVACFLAFGWAVLREIEHRGVVRPRHVALTVLGATALGAIVGSPMGIILGRAVHSALAVDIVPFWAGVNWPTALGRAWSLSVPTVLIVSSMSTLAMLYIVRTARTAEALAAAQLRLAEAQRRALAEQLLTAQAMVDPTFLFETLGQIEQHFEGEPLLAQRLLDALIRYLRAALPVADEVVGTLGQQAELMRAYLEIESIRSAGRLQASVEVPTALESRPFAPALILPLVSLAVGGHDELRRDIRVEVRAAVGEGRLVVQVEEDRSERGRSIETATLASLRQRVAILYGHQAVLSFAARQSCGSSAQIIIDDPGTP